MIHITSEGNLFTSFCHSVAGTASFHHLAVTALFLLYSQFFLVLFHCKKKKNKTKKKVLQDRFCVVFVWPY